MRETFPIKVEAMRERATAWLAEPGEPAPTKPSVTVMLVRAPAQGEGVEVFMIRRHSKMAFMPTAAVFPGGGLDAHDVDDIGWAGPSPEELAKNLGVDAQTARRLVVAAARELFEEAAILLAGPSADTLVQDVSQFATQREAIEAHQLTFAQFLNDNDLVLRADLLAARSRFITPAFEPRRFDTWFFTAAQPEGQQAEAITTEAERSGWFRPEDVVVAGEEARMLVLLPTEVNLRQLATATDVADATQNLQIVPSIPSAVPDDAGVLVLRPGPTEAPSSY